MNKRVSDSEIALSYHVVVTKNGTQLNVICSRRVVSHEVSDLCLTVFEHARGCKVSTTGKLVQNLEGQMSVARDVLCLRVDGLDLRGF